MKHYILKIVKYTNGIREHYYNLAGYFDHKYWHSITIKISCQTVVLVDAQ